MAVVVLDINKLGCAPLISKRPLGVAVPIPTLVPLSNIILSCIVSESSHLETKFVVPDPVTLPPTVSTHCTLVPVELNT